MNVNSETVLNGTNGLVDTSVGQIRVFETNSGLTIEHHVTERERLYSEYSNFAVKTAQSTVEMCRVVFEAKKGLSSSEYSEFLKDVGHTSGNSTIRKYLAIGEQYDKFIQYAKLLPNSWTSIYEITQIPSDVFMIMVETGNSMANLTGAQIKLLKATKESADKVKLPDSEMPSAAPVDALRISVQPIDSVHSLDADKVNETDTLPDVAAIAHSRVAETQAAALLADVGDRFVAPQTKTSLFDSVSTPSARADIAVDADESYEVIIRFKTRPTDTAASALVDALSAVLSKYRIDGEIVTSSECAN